MLFSLLLITLLATQIFSQNIPYDPREATISSVHNALFSRSTTCHAIVSSFITRIVHFNPLVNAVVTLNPDALAIASSLDHALASGNATGLLFCIPVLLKDNYDALPMPTTGGCLALNSSYPDADAPSVTTLRRAGAVILGKTNLHELALEGLTVSSLGGQTINPYDHTLTPGGSSGGTGAAIAASFAVFGTGTDTVNSLRSPASANSLYSFRPTRGLISRTGVIPVSHTQDTLGAIGRCLPDIATALTIMASIGPDPRDNATSSICQSVTQTDYTTFLSPKSLPLLRNLRIGIIRGFYNNTTPSPTSIPVTTAMNNLESLLTSHNTTIIDITSPIFNSTHLLATHDVQRFEFSSGLSSYLSSPHLSGPHPRSSEELYLNTAQYLVIPHQHPFLRYARFNASTPAAKTEYDSGLTSIENLKQHLHSQYTFLGLDVIIYPQQSTLPVPLSSSSQTGRNGILAALTGFPVITIPLGFSEPSATSATGVPVGMEVMGLPFHEGRTLGVAAALDAVVRARRRPAGLGMDGDMLGKGTWEDRSEGLSTGEDGALRVSVPDVKPLENIDTRAYPLGSIGIQ